MSKRFGRNQRRQMREALEASRIALLTLAHEADKKIAARDAAIASLRVGEWAISDGTLPDIADIAGHITAHEVTEGTDYRGRREKIARITCHPENRHLATLRSGNQVSWRGGVWYIKKVHVPSSCRYDDFDPIGASIEIDLAALPPKKLDSRQPTVFLYGRDLPDEVAVRAIDGSRFSRADSRPVMRIN